MNAQQILETLRLEREVAAQRVTHIDEAIATLERLAAPVTVTAAAPAQPGKRKSAIDWARARQQYENAGTPVPKIATALEARMDVWWCSKCDSEWTVPSLPHNPKCPTCGTAGWWRRFA